VHGCEHKRAAEHLSILFITPTLQLKLVQTTNTSHIKYIISPMLGSSSDSDDSIYLHIYSDLKSTVVLFRGSGFWDI